MEDKRAKIGCLIKGEAPPIVVGTVEGTACIGHVAFSNMFGFFEVSLPSHVSDHIIGCQWFVVNVTISHDIHSKGSGALVNVLFVPRLVKVELIPE